MAVPGALAGLDDGADCELVFYGALGLPLVLEPPVGAHEVRNRDLVVSAGVGCDRPTPGTIASWIAARLDDGWFARVALIDPERATAPPASATSHSFVALTSPGNSGLSWAGGSDE